MRPQTSISQLSVPPSAYWPTELPTVEVEMVPPLRLPPELLCVDRAGVADGRIERRLALADQRNGLAVGRLRDLEVLVGDVDLRGELIERRVAVHAPPLAAIDRVARHGGAEVRVAGLLELGRRRRRRLRPLVVGTDQAAGQPPDNSRFATKPAVRRPDHMGRCPTGAEGSWGPGLMTPPSPYDGATQGGSWPIAVTRAPRSRPSPAPAGCGCRGRGGGSGRDRCRPPASCRASGSG